MRGTDLHFPVMKEADPRSFEMTGTGPHSQEMTGVDHHFLGTSGIDHPFQEKIMISRFLRGGKEIVGHHHQGMRGTDGFHSRETIATCPNGNEDEEVLPTDLCLHQEEREEEDLHSMMMTGGGIDLRPRGPQETLLVARGLPLGVTLGEDHHHPHLRNMIGLVGLFLRMMQSSLMTEEDLRGTGIEMNGGDPRVTMSGQGNRAT